MYCIYSYSYIMLIVCVCVCVRRVCLVLYKMSSKINHKTVEAMCVLSVYTPTKNLIPGKLIYYTFLLLSSKTTYFVEEY